MRSLRNMGTKRRPRSDYKFFAPDLYWAIIVAFFFGLFLEFWLHLELFSIFRGHWRILWYNDFLGDRGVGVVSVISSVMNFSDPILS